MPDTRFKLGNPGKPVGAVSHVTRDAKAMLQLAAEGAGGLEALTAFAIAKPEAFWPLYAKLVPRQIEQSGLDGAPLTITLVRK